MNNRGSSHHEGQPPLVALLPSVQLSNGQHCSILINCPAAHLPIFPEVFRRKSGWGPFADGILLGVRRPFPVVCWGETRWTVEYPCSISSPCMGQIQHSLRLSGTPQVATCPARLYSEKAKDSVLLGGWFWNMFSSCKPILQMIHFSNVPSKYSYIYGEWILRRFLQEEHTNGEQMFLSLLPFYASPPSLSISPTFCP